MFSFSCLLLSSRIYHCLSLLYCLLLVLIIHCFMCDSFFVVRVYHSWFLNGVRALDGALPFSISALFLLSESSFTKCYCCIAINWCHIQSPKTIIVIVSLLRVCYHIILSNQLVWLMPSLFFSSLRYFCYCSIRFVCWCHRFISYKLFPPVFILFFIW